HHAGIAIACCLFLSLCGVLTLAPALLCLFGRWAFWPWKGARDHSAPAGGILHRLEKVATLGLSWNKLAAALERMPGRIWLGTVALMLPFAVLALLNSNNQEFDLVTRLPSDAPSLAGMKALKEHFPEGITGSVIVLVHQPGVNFGEADGEGLVATLTDRLT